MDVMIRVDARDASHRLLEPLTEVSVRNDYLFFSIQSQHFIDPTLGRLLQAIAGSKTFGFWEDPQNIVDAKDYFDAIGKEVRKRLARDDSS